MSRHFIWILSQATALSISLPMVLAGQSTERSFRSVNYPDRFILHRGADGVLQPVQARSDSLDATFRIVPGLADPNLVSIMAVDRPDHYLRHSNFILRLNALDGSQLFKKDATFKVVRGLAGNGVSFESVNYPGYYIRHQSFRLLLNRYDGTDLFRKDASFALLDGLASVAPPATQPRRPGRTGPPPADNGERERAIRAASAAQGCWLETPSPGHEERWVLIRTADGGITLEQLDFDEGTSREPGAGWYSARSAVLHYQNGEFTDGNGKTIGFYDGRRGWGNSRQGRTGYYRVPLDPDFPRLTYTEWRDCGDGCKSPWTYTAPTLDADDCNRLTRNRRDEYDRPAPAGASDTHR